MKNGEWVDSHSHTAGSFAWKCHLWAEMGLSSLGGKILGFPSSKAEKN